MDGSDSASSFFLRHHPNHDRDGDEGCNNGSSGDMARHPSTLRKKRPRANQGAAYDYAAPSKVASESAHERDFDYSITSSAVASSVGGTSIPSAMAVLRLMTSSYLVGACTGRSAGFSPLRIRPT